MTGAKSTLERTPVQGKVLKGKADSVAAVQAGIEGVPVNIGDTVSFQGQLFRVADKVGLMPLLKFAHSAASGATEDDMEGMAAMYAMIRDCIHPGDWDRFEQVAIDTHAEGDELFELVGTVLELVAARPTRQPSGSSAPEASTSRKLKRGSSPGGSVPSQAEGLVPIGELLLSTP